MQILAPELSDRVLKDFLDIESNVIVNIHVQSVDQVAAIKTIKRTITDLDKTKIEEQKKAVRAGYDMDILPSDLATYGEEAKKLLSDLQSRNQRMFLITFLILNTADTKRQLDNNFFQTNSIAQKYNCQLVQLDFQQEEGMVSSLPLGLNQIEIQRGLTSSGVAIFVPFTTQELFQNSPEALYCGINALSNNIIMVDRKWLKNPNGLILGTPGSGKSFAAKREIVNVFLATNDDIMICDPEGEYYPLVHRLDGQVIKISPTSHHHINPMDINLNYSDEDNPLSLKSDFILSLCELIVGGKEGLKPVEKTVIDRCVRMIYQKYLSDPRPENMPILGDLYNCLRKQEEKEAQFVATALEIYVDGSLNVFNHRTDVDVSNRVVCYDIKELGKQLKKIGMLIVQDQVWNRVTRNREARKATRYYIDEFHLLLKEEQTAAYSVEIWKRFRKMQGCPTGITQNVVDLLASKEVETIFAKMLIDLTQHATRCSDSSGQAQEYLIARHAAVETETVLVQICLELGAPSVICSLKECFQITDCLVYPMQIICFVFLCVQFHTFQIQVASVTVAFYLRFRHKILVDDFLQSLSLYVIYYLHPGKQWCTVCGFGYGHHNLGLIRTTTSFAVMGRSANIAVIQLYNAGKQVFFVSLTHSGTNSIQ